MALEVLAKSKKKISVGDVFTLKLVDGEYYYGLVVNENLGGEGRESAYKGGLLVYIYNQSNSEKSSKIDDKVFSKENLIIPPKIVSKFMWWKGYFESLEQNIENPEIFDTHCFSWIKGTVNEFGERVTFLNRIGGSVSPCGRYQLEGWDSIGEEIRERLGINQVGRINNSIKPGDGDYNAFFTDNDASLDWIAGLSRQNMLVEVERVLDRVLKRKNEQFIDAENTSILLGACELTLVVVGKGLSSSNVYLEELLSNKVKRPSNNTVERLLTKSQKVVSYILERSELLDRSMWKKKEFFLEWQKAVEDMLKRLKRGKRSGVD